MTDPASIRTNNPGAQWMGPVARQYGATDSIDLPGGNNAAVFPDPVTGAAAQFALLGNHYAGKPLSAAISSWSGGNSSPAYTAFLTKQTGLTPDTVLTKDLLAGPQGLALAKAQAQWEAGRPYPLSDDGWQQAQSRAFGGASGTAPAGPAIGAPSGPSPAAPGAGMAMAPPDQPAPFDPQQQTAALLAQQQQSQGQMAPAPDMAPPPQMAPAPQMMPQPQQGQPQPGPQAPQMPVNLARLRNVMALRPEANQMPLPPDVAQRLAALMERS